MQYDIALERRLAEPNDLSLPNHVDLQEAASTPRSSDVRSLPVMAPYPVRARTHTGCSDVRPLPVMVPYPNHHELLIYVHAYGLQKNCQH